MKTKWLHKAIPLTLSAGMVLGVPAMMPQFVPEAFVAQAFASKAQPAAQAKEASWDFRDGMDGWKYGGKWDYKGEPVIEASKEHGGTVKLGVNYAENKDSGWSEVKLEYGKTPLDVTGANTVSYDLYYQPSRAGSSRRKSMRKTRRMKKSSTWHLTSTFRRQRRRARAGMSCMSPCRCRM